MKAKNKRLFDDLNEEIDGHREYIDELNEEFERRTADLHNSYGSIIGLRDEEFQESQERVAILEADRDALEVKIEASYEREHKYRAELAKSNQSWAVAKASLERRDADKRELQSEVNELKQTLNNSVDAFDAAIAEVKEECEAQRKELAASRAHLSRVRAAFDPLNNALYPLTLLPPNPVLPNLPFKWEPHVVYNPTVYNPTPNTGVITLSCDEDVRKLDSVARLHEAGYSCATGKREQQEAAAGYSGLA